VLVRDRWGRRVALGVAIVWLGWFAALETARFWAWWGRGDVWEAYYGPLAVIGRQIAGLPEDTQITLGNEFTQNDAFGFLMGHRWNQTGTSDSWPLLWEVWGMASSEPPEYMVHMRENPTQHFYYFTGLGSHRVEEQRTLLALEPTGSVDTEVLRGPNGKPFAHHLVFTAATSPEVSM
jgi:hypothetical protein